MPLADATKESRRSPRWQARREAIIDTSARLFASRGYHATGISELWPRRADRRRSSWPCSATSCSM
jgi:hypothetical protein